MDFSRLSKDAPEGPSGVCMSCGSPHLWKPSPESFECLDCSAVMVLRCTAEKETLHLRDDTQKTTPWLKLHDKGVLSKETLLEKLGLDYGQELYVVKSDDGHDMIATKPEETAEANDVVDDDPTPDMAAAVRRCAFADGRYRDPEAAAKMGMTVDQYEQFMLWGD